MGKIIASNTITNVRGLLVIRDFVFVLVGSSEIQASSQHGANMRDLAGT